MLSADGHYDQSVDVWSVGCILAGPSRPVQRGFATVPLPPALLPLSLACVAELLGRAPLFAGEGRSMLRPTPRTGAHFLACHGPHSLARSLTLTLSFCDSRVWLCGQARTSWKRCPCRSACWAHVPPRSWRTSSACGDEWCQSLSPPSACAVWQVCRSDQALDFLARMPYKPKVSWSTLYPDASDKALDLLDKVRLMRDGSHTRHAHFRPHLSCAAAAIPPLQATHRGGGHGAPVF